MFVIPNTVCIRSHILGGWFYAIDDILKICLVAFQKTCIHIGIQLCDFVTPKEWPSGRPLASQSVRSYVRSLLTPPLRVDIYIYIYIYNFYARNVLVVLV